MIAPDRTLTQAYIYSLHRALLSLSGELRMYRVDLSLECQTACVLLLHAPSPYCVCHCTLLIVNHGLFSVCMRVRCPHCRHHVRLSLDSAKRLRWIESEDVSALVRRHSQEKNLMGECVSAMRKFLLQKGFEVSSINTLHPCLCHCPHGLEQPRRIQCIPCYHAKSLSQSSEEMRSIYTLNHDWC